MPTTVRSHAKINLGLYIGAPRPDGFHQLATVYQTLEIHDLVTVMAHPANGTSIRLTSDDDRVPIDHRNTAWKMVLLALEDLKTPAEVSIRIEKRLPVQGGLGAGSANAVAALVGLETELKAFGSARATGHASGWLDPSELAEKIRVPDGVPDGDALQFSGPSLLAKRIELAARVGSDVPLFLVGGAVLGRDRGESVLPLPDFEPVWCVVALPEIGVSTPQAFRNWDALCASEGLTEDVADDRLERSSRAYVSAFAGEIPPGEHRAGSSGVLSFGEDLAGPEESALVRTGILSWIQNDFERVVFSQHPSLAEIKRILAASGSPEAAHYASLSGSGSALYGLYLTCRAAEAAQSRLAKAGVRSELTRTLPRRKYWHEMLLANEG